MSAIAHNVNVKTISRGHNRSRRGIKISNLNSWCVMQCIDLFDVKRIQDILFDHDLSTAAVFLGWLKDQRNAACKITGFSQVTCSS